MAGDLTFLERIRGKRTRDIHLPQEAHTTRDPRLPQPTTLQSAREGLDRLRDVGRRQTAPARPVRRRR